MRDADGVQAVAELATKAADPKIITAGGTQFVAIGGKLEDPRRPDPRVAVIELHTLGGLMEFVAANRDRINLDAAVLHVESPTRVTLFGPPNGHHKLREVFAGVTCADRFAGIPGGFRFGTYVDTESMVIALQALFEAEGDRATVLKLIGNLTAEGTVKRLDDGVSQTVTARSGISMVDQVPVPNPVQLAPFRTFAEVGQPVSPFVLRVRKQGDAVTAALFEADGGAWKMDAIASIAGWLQGELESREIDLPVLA